MYRSLPGWMSAVMVRVLIKLPVTMVLKGAPLLLVGLALVGCGDGSRDGGETPESLTQQGWAFFENGNYRAAFFKFEAALGLDKTYADAHNGMGWCYSVADQFKSAIESFSRAIDNGIDVADPYAGKALVYRDYTAIGDHFQRAIASAESALSISRRYVFEHDPRLDWKDLMLVLAQSHYGLGNYEVANAWVDSLPDGVAADPMSPDFVWKLALEIERLGSIYGN